MNAKEDIFILLCYAGAACAGMCLRWARGIDKKKRTIAKAVVDIATVLFCSMLVWGLADGVGISDRLGCALAALAGYVGVKSIDLIIAIVEAVAKKKAGVTDKEEGGQ